MKKTLLTPILLMATVSLFSQFDFSEYTGSKKVGKMINFLEELPHSTREDLFLKGKVKSMTSTHYVWKTLLHEEGNETEQKREFLQKSLTYKFDQQGRPIEYIEEDSNIGNKKTIFKYSYPDLSTNQFNKVIITERRKYDEMNADEETITINFLLDHKKRISSFTLRMNKEVDYMTGKLSYLPTGKIDKTILTTFREKGTRRRMEQYCYENGKLIKVEAGKAIYIAKTGKYKFKESDPEFTKIDYNAEGKIMAVKKPYGQELLLSYYPDGKLREEIELGYSSDTTNITTYLYDSEGNETERIVTENNYSEETIHYDYDQQQEEVVATPAQESDLPPADTISTTNDFSYENGEEAIDTVAVDYVTEAVRSRKYEETEEVAGNENEMANFEIQDDFSGIRCKRVLRFINHILVSVHRYERSKTGEMKLMRIDQVETKKDVQGNLIESIIREGEGPVQYRTVYTIEYYE